MVAVGAALLRHQQLTQAVGLEVRLTQQLLRATLRLSLEEVVELRQALRQRMALMQQPDFSKRARVAVVASTVQVSLVERAVQAAGPVAVEAVAVHPTTDLILVQVAMAGTVSP